MLPEEFLRAKFRDYYLKHEVAQPPAPEQREFGFGTFGRKIADRHLEFASHESVNKFLRAEVPFYLSYSAAYYKFPSRKPMQAKEYLGGDLVYEFDADDLKTECKVRHDTWACKCGASGRGNPERCTECGEGVSVRQWVCPECLYEVKLQVFELLKFLQDDFGFTEGISVNFSGHKGYHVHVRSEAVRALSPRARIELVDYITGHELDLRALGFYSDGKRMFCPPPAEAAGWGEKLLNGLEALFDRADADEIATAGGIPSGTLAKSLASEGKGIIAEMRNGILRQLPRVSAKKTESFWNHALSHLAEKLRLDIDRQTSVDVAKIVRVPETIHGGTGLVAKSVEIGALRDFLPLEDTLAFGSAPVKVITNSVPKFSIGGAEFGPLEQGVHELPEFAAIYLLARGDATGPGK
ncbi:MAG: DNA primase small subunit domain-containing protein [Candidatus Diapherotrites archaeon]